jgi:hypothetical protein
MNLSPIGSFLSPASGIGLANTCASMAGGTVGSALGKNLGIGGLGSELSAGLSDDTNSVSMLAQLASTLGNAATSLESQVNNEVNSSVGATTASSALSPQLNSVTVPSSNPSQQAFRSFSSLQPTQQGGSGSDAMLAGLIGGDASDNVEEA